MAILIGVDEAGYGPNLGPLVVAASAWATASAEDDLYDTLADAIVRAPTLCGRLAIADSKQLYKSGGGLRQLELGVLAALSLVGRRCEELAPPREPRLPWDCAAEESTPIDADTSEVAQGGCLLREACSSHGVQPLAVAARVVEPAEFNELCERHGTKGAALSAVTLRLLRTVLDDALDAATAYSRLSATQPRPSLVAAGGVETTSYDSSSASCRSFDGTRTHVRATLDKHGGRNRYAAVLQDAFPDGWIETVRESRAASRYRWIHRDAAVTAEFRVGGEAELPTALASMTAKYLRERAMRRFNRWWQSHVPNLRPTAGYPVDARRFRCEIADAQRRLKIDDRLLWRNR